MIELGKTKRKLIQELAADSQEVLIRTAAEGTMGRVWGPNLDCASYCLIRVGDFAYLLGIQPKGEGALHLKTQIYESCQGAFLVPENERWALWLEEQFQGEYRLVSRYALKKEERHFDREQLKVYAAAVPDGIRIKRMDERLYHLAMKEEWSRDFCANFEDEKQFMEDGIGYVAMKGRELVSGCSAYGISRGMIEIQVETKENYRRQGLALACSAAFLLECLDRGLLPNWDAANLQSVGLAEKLGYVYDREYQVYQLVEL